MVQLSESHKFQRILHYGSEVGTVEQLCCSRGLKDIDEDSKSTRCCRTRTLVR
jgi:hypothetical protein